MLFPQIPRSLSIEFPKLVSCFALSAALHASALLYHEHFAGQIEEQLIPVVVLGMDRLGGDSRGGVAPESGDGTGRSIATPPGRAAPVKFIRRGISRSAKPEQRLSAGAAVPQRRGAAEPLASAASGAAMVAAVDTDAAQAAPAIFSSSAAVDGAAPGARGRVGGSTYGGGNGTASDSGPASSGGAGSSPSPPRFVEARYRDAPKPEYPESARREGQEGRVLLRVLVDREGKSRTIEVSGSSGSELLDRAAAETIKHWRFLPARYGDNPVESWVRIPIDFRLTAAQEH